MPLLNFTPQQLGLLGDSLSGIGMGLLNQQPNSAGQYSALGGVGQGLQYAQGLQQQARAQEQDQLQMQMQQRQADQQAEKFAWEKQQLEDQKKSQAAQQAAIGQWVQTQPPEQQALFQAFPDQAATAYFAAQKPQQQPGGVQEYEYAKQQGYKGTLLDFEREKAAAGRAPV